MPKTIVMEPSEVVGKSGRLSEAALEEMRADALREMQDFSPEDRELALKLVESMIETLRSQHPAAASMKNVLKMLKDTIETLQPIPRALKALGMEFDGRPRGHGNGRHIYEVGGIANMVLMAEGIVETAFKRLEMLTQCSCFPGNEEAAAGQTTKEESTS